MNHVGNGWSIAKVAMNVLLRRTFEATLQLTGRLAMVADSDPATELAESKAKMSALMPAITMGAK